MLGEKQIKDLLTRRKTPCVFLESAGAVGKTEKNYLFKDFKEILVFKHGQDAQTYLKVLEAKQKAGFWLAGYFTYEFGYYLDEAHAPLRKDFGFPLAWMGVCKKPQIVRPSGRRQSSEELHYQIKNITAGISEERYGGALARIKKFLEEGLTYQVNYTFKEMFGFSGNPVDFYLALRRSQPTGYAAYIDAGGYQAVSMSPELFFRQEKKTITVRPMKGTLARGCDADSDNGNRRILARDPKIKAENLMIVDLLRNDLGRICDKVRTKSLFDIEKHHTLFQMTSTIEGRLNKKAGLPQVMSALFPSGSVTGAPKIKTMQLIGGLEPRPRGIYTGAIGYLAPGGRACFSVAIRTAQIAGGHGILGVGGGIVYDSQPAQEYQEAVLKAKFLAHHYPPFALVETLLWEKGKGYYLLPQHLERLRRSGEYFMRHCAIKKLQRHLGKIAGKFRYDQMRVRLSLNPYGDVIIEARDLKPLPKKISLCLSPERVSSGDIFLRHKTDYRVFYDAALRDARRQGYQEVLFLNERGELTEGSFSNLFIEKDGILYTPPLSCGLLPGVLREYLLAGGKAKEKILYPGDLKEADKIYIGNSVRGLVRVSLTG